MIILSVKPEFAHAICNGEKTVEFRRRRPPPTGEPVLIYATSPAKKLVGVCYFKFRDSGSPNMIVDKYTDGCRNISARWRLDEYYEGCDIAYALLISHAGWLAFTLDPKTLFGAYWRPPVSWMRVTGWSVSYSAVTGTYTLIKQEGPTPAGNHLRI